MSGIWDAVEREYPSAGVEQKDRRPFLIVFAAIVVVAAGAAYYFWTASPTYALRQAADAIRDRDLTTFRKFVDLPNLVTRFTADSFGAELDDAPPDAAAFAEGIVAMVQPRLTEALQRSFERAIETGEFDPKAAPAVATKHWSKRDDPDSARIVYVRRSGATARAGVQLADNVTVEFMLRDTGRHWQITEISNLRELLSAKRGGE